MLSRRCQTLVKVCLMMTLTASVLPMHWLLSDQKSLQEEGLRFGKQAHKNCVDFENSLCMDDITPLDARGKTFDAEEAKRLIKEKNIPQNAFSELASSQRTNAQQHQLDDESIAHSDALVDNYAKGFIQQSGDEGYKIETCLQYDAPFELEVTRTLSVKVRKSPAVETEVHVCNGHQREKSCAYGKRDAAIKKQRKKLAADPTIQSFQVEKMDGYPAILIKWKHHDNVAACANSKIEKRVVSEAHSDIEAEAWSTDNQDNDKLSQTPQCTFIKSVKATPETRHIDGIDVTRSWLKTDLYVCNRDQVKCPFLGSYRCVQQSKRCTQQSGDQCAIWEMIFKCKVGNGGKGDKGDQPKIRTEEAFGASSNLWETSYQPNSSFSEVATKLKVFEEMKREFEQSKQPNIAHIQLFGGKKSQCSKSVAGDLMYDCCFSFHGLTNTLKLSKCTADELALAEMRDKGLCYYIGSHKDTFLGIWNSRTEHVYCCFQTKLARVLQQEGRQQLSIDWGTPTSPDCRGLTQEEIQHLNLAKIDLSEAYSAPPSVDMTDKLQGIQERLKRRLAECNGG